MLYGWIWDYTAQNIDGEYLTYSFCPHCWTVLDMASDGLLVILFHVILVFSIVSAEQSLSLVAEMGDTLEFNDIYQEVKGSWVSMFFSTLYSLFMPIQEPRQFNTP